MQSSTANYLLEWMYLGRYICLTCFYFFSTALATNNTQSFLESLHITTESLSKTQGMKTEASVVSRFTLDGQLNIKELLTECMNNLKKNYPNYDLKCQAYRTNRYFAIRDSSGLTLRECWLMTATKRGQTIVFQSNLHLKAAPCLESDR